MWYCEQRGQRRIKSAICSACLGRGLLTASVCPLALAAMGCDANLDASGIRCAVHVATDARWKCEAKYCGGRCAWLAHTPSLLRARKRSSRPGGWARFGEVRPRRARTSASSALPVVVVSFLGVRPCIRPSLAPIRFLCPLRRGVASIVAAILRHPRGGLCAGVSRCVPPPPTHCGVSSPRRSYPWARGSAGAAATPRGGGTGVLGLCNSVDSIACRHPHSALGTAPRFPSQRAGVTAVGPESPRVRSRTSRGGLPRVGIAPHSPTCMASSLRARCPERCFSGALPCGARHLVFLLLCLQVHA